MIKKLSAFRIYLIFSGATALFFSLVFTVSSVYQIETINLNPLQLILVGTALETACFIFEIPTGIVADIYSRKLSVVIGVALIGTGFILEGIFPTFIAVVGAQILWGLGYTFISGAMDAWIAEEEKNMELDNIYMRSSQISQIFSITGIILSTIIANFSLRLPIILGGLLFIALSLFLKGYMPENNFKASAPEELNTFGKMAHTLKTSFSYIKRRPILTLLLSVTLFYGLSSEGYDRLYTAHFLQDTTLPKLWDLQPVTWFGIFSIIGMVLSTTAMQLIIKILKNNKRLRSFSILIISNIFYVAFVAVFALTGNFALMLTAYLSVTMFRTINEPLYNALINSTIEDNARATILSTNGQINALGQILGGPIIGLIASKTSVSIGIACTSIMLAPVVILYIISMVSHKKEYNAHKE